VISGAQARRLTMRLRAQADAVVVGAHTARVDDPSLLVRDEAGAPTQRQPLRVVLARNAAPDASLLHDGLGPAVALLPEEWAGDAPPGAEVMTYDGHAGVRGALAALAGRGVASVVVEAGPGMLTALWETHLIDELVLYHAGGMAGQEAPAMFYGKSNAQGDTLMPAMAGVECAVVGDDVVTVWRPRASADA